MKRRFFINSILTGIIAAPFTLLLRKSSDDKVTNNTLWQIDPDKCTHCGKCVTECILPHSAVKCVHQYASCGYCLFCSGYYQDKRAKFDTAGENLRCPTDAISRTYIEDPYFEYKIDEEKCIACAKCVKGCEAFGNGSLFLQVRHNICVSCNQCRIASVCPSEAFIKVSPDKPYIIKTLQEDAT
ncbi:MAG: ferredoxin [Phycisphaeraceae bacterium]|nr:ferredoxin [Phycisphaeraceae bacterium]